MEEPGFRTCANNRLPAAAKPNFASPENPKPTFAPLNTQEEKLK